MSSKEREAAASDEVWFERNPFRRFRLRQLVAENCEAPLWIIAERLPNGAIARHPRHSQDLKGLLPADDASLAQELRNPSKMTSGVWHDWRPIPWLVHGGEG